MQITFCTQFDVPNYDGPLVDVTLVSFNVEYQKEYAPAFAKLLAKMPKWTDTTASVSSLESWIF